MRVMAIYQQLPLLKKDVLCFSMQTILISPDRSRVNGQSSNRFSFSQYSAQRASIAVGSYVVGDRAACNVKTGIMKNKSN